MATKLILLPNLFLLLLLVGCTSLTQETSIPLSEVLLIKEEVGPAFMLVEENTGLRTTADYNLEEGEWEEFKWKEGYKITFENQPKIDDNYAAIFNYNSRYLNQEVMFEEYQESKHSDKKFTVVNAPLIGEDSIAFFFSYETNDSEVRQWTEVDLTFIKYDIYENIAILRPSRTMEVEETLAQAVTYAMILERKIDQAAER